MIRTETAVPPFINQNLDAQPARKSPAGWIAILGFVFLSSTPLLAAENTTEGLIVQIPTSITTESTGRLRALLHGPLKRFEQGSARQGGKFILICDFNPDSRRADCDDFGACFSLATFLRSLQAERQGIRTIAYIHSDVSRHSVLPVLACNEIVFSSKARLGPVAQGNKPMLATERTGYEEITRNRYPQVLIRKLYDPSVEVLRVGDNYINGSARPRPKGEPVPELAGDQPIGYDFPLARKLGLCQQLSSATLDEVRIAYGLPRTSFRRTLDNAVCRRIPITGSLNGETVEQTKRRILRAIQARATVIILEISCAGGDLAKASELGQYLAGINDNRTENPIETIAFVTSRARNLATFLAFSCNKIIMQLEDGEEKDLNPDDEDDSLPKEARLGGFHHFLRRHPSVEPLKRELDQPGLSAARRVEIDRQMATALSEVETTLSRSLVEIAKKQMYPTILAEGMASPGLRIHLVERAKGNSARTFLSEQAFREDQAGPKVWRSIELIKPWHGQDRFEGRYLTLTARQAKEVGLVHAVVKDINELYEVEGIAPGQVRTIESDWLDGLADFLRTPWVRVVLVMLGITCLILELKMPGVGLPGVIAAICFVLFFWAHSQLNGQITWLAILLFLLGLILLGLEIFVLPGFGVCGISGILMVLASLGLVAYGHWPRTGEEWIGLGHKIGPFGISLFGALVFVAITLRYLPHIPVLNRLMHRPPEEGDSLAEHDNQVHTELVALLGAIGVAATPLRPAGKSQFGETFVDVVAEGGYIMPGTRVQVVEVEGNRVVVKEV